MGVDTVIWGSTMNPVKTLDRILLCTVCVIVSILWVVLTLEFVPGVWYEVGYHFAPTLVDECPAP